MFSFAFQSQFNPLHQTQAILADIWGSSQSFHCPFIICHWSAKTYLSTQEGSPASPFKHLAFMSFSPNSHHDNLSMLFTMQKSSQENNIKLAPLFSFLCRYNKDNNSGNQPTNSGSCKYPQIGGTPDSATLANNEVYRGCQTTSCCCRVSCPSQAVAPASAGQPRLVLPDATSPGHKPLLPLSQNWHLPEPPASQPRLSTNHQKAPLCF